MEEESDWKSKNRPWVPEWDGENVEIPRKVNHDYVVNAIIDSICMLDIFISSKILVVTAFPERASKTSRATYARRDAFIKHYWVFDDASLLPTNLADRKDLVDDRIVLRMNKLISRGIRGGTILLIGGDHKYATPLATLKNDLGWTVLLIYRMNLVSDDLLEACSFCCCINYAYEKDERLIWGLGSTQKLSDIGTRTKTNRQPPDGPQPTCFKQVIRYQIPSIDKKDGPPKVVLKCR